MPAKTPQPEQRCGDAQRYISGRLLRGKIRLLDRASRRVTAPGDGEQLMHPAIRRAIRMQR